MVAGAVYSRDVRGRLDGKTTTRNRYGTSGRVTCAADRIALAVEIDSHGSDAVAKHRSRSLAEASRADGGIDAAIQNGVDFAKQEGNVGTVGDARISSPRSASRRWRGRHYQHSVKTHWTLDGGMRAGLDQVSAGLQTGPGQRNVPGSVTSLRRTERGSLVEED